MAERNYDSVTNFSIPGYADLGWQLDPRTNPELLKCKAAGHKTREHDNSMYRFRATDIVRICDECKHIHHIDMSD